MNRKFNAVKSLFILLIVLSGFLASHAFGEPKAVMTPDPTFVIDAWAYGYPEPTNTIYCGNIAPLDITQIDPASFTVNTNIVPDSCELIPAMEGFDGAVWKLVINRRNFINGYGLVYDSTQHRYYVHAEIPGKCEVWINGWVYLRGEGPGDANGDGQVNMLDVVLLVNHIYGAHPAAYPVRPAGDYNRDGRYDLIDILGVIDRIKGIVRT